MQQTPVAGQGCVSAGAAPDGLTRPASGLLLSRLRAVAAHPPVASAVLHPAAMGVFVCMTEPTRGMIDAANHSGMYVHPATGQHYPKVQLVTVRESGPRPRRRPPERGLTSYPLAAGAVPSPGVNVRHPSCDARGRRHTCF